MDLVSVVVPIYNCEQSLYKSLYSLQNQTYKNIEVILVNDGSVDSSLSVCEQFCSQDNRFKCLNQENHGVSYSRNRGINEASGKYIMFVDGDDDVLPDMIQRYVSKAEEVQADVVIGGILMIEEDGEIIRKTPVNTEKISSKKFFNMVCEDETGIFGYVPNKLYRLSILKEHKIRFREDMAAQEDLEFALSAYSVCKDFCCFDYCGYRYYHSYGKRKMPLEDLVENQRKLIRLAEAVHVSQKSLFQVRRRIQSAAYNAVFHAGSRNQIEKLNGIFCVEDFEKVEGHTREVQMILWLFVKRKYGTIDNYFKIRGKIKKLLGKETL